MHWRVATTKYFLKPKFLTYTINSMEDYGGNVELTMDVYTMVTDTMIILNIF